MLLHAADARQGVANAINESLNKDSAMVDSALQSDNKLQAAKVRVMHPE